MKLGKCWILSIILATCVIGCEKKVEEGGCRVSTTKASLKTFHQAVVQFKKDTGRYPTEQEGLMALIKNPGDVSNYPPGGYLGTTDLPKDNWGNDFVYKYEQFVIISYGADGKPGGKGRDADMYSTAAF